ncbi:hypothetical protein HDE_14100 [Halotydeus destructor]|nr:hypothetical protein HDE_14100 [Halotydeus destructor]
MVWHTNYNTFKPEDKKLESPSNVATIICAILGLELVVFLSLYYFDVQDKRSVVGVWMICSVGILLIVIHLFEPKDSKLRQLSVLTNTVLVLVVLIGLLLIFSVQYSSRQVEILNSKVKVEDLLRHVDTVLFDFDGTLVDNNYRPKDGAAEVLNALKRREEECSNCN